MEQRNLIEEIPVTWIQNVINHNGNPISLSEIISMIRQGTPEIIKTQELIRQADDQQTRRYLKKSHLPAFAMGEYAGEYIDSAKCLQTQGMIIDIDHLEARQYPAVFERVRATPEVIFAFRSPSGDGIKAVLFFDEPIQVFEKDGRNVLPEFFKVVYRYYAKKFFDLSELDDKTCDICRLCYLAHDPGIYVNPAPRPISVWNESTAITQFAKEHGYSAGQETAQATFQEVDLTDDIKGRITDASRFLSDLPYHEWIRVGMALKSLGEWGWQTFRCLSLASKNYKDTEHEIRSKFEQLGKGECSGRKVTLGTYFHLAKSRGWTPPPMNYLTSTPDNFWTVIPPSEEGEEEEVKFSDLKLIGFLVDQGFRKFKFKDDKGFSFVQVVENVIYRKFIVDMIDFLRSHIEANAPKASRSLILGSFLSLHEKFSRESKYVNLPFLAPNIIQDTAKEAFYFFKNCWVTVTEDGIDVRSYADLGGQIYSEQVIPRDFNLQQNHGDFEKFIRNVTTHDDQIISEKRFDSLRSAMGYLVHSYSNQDKAIILTDEKFTPDTDDANGGTGKTLIARSCGHLKPVIVIDGKDWDNGRSFKFQEVSEYTRILNFNDLKSNFNFDDVFSVVTEGLTIEKKNKSPFRMDGLTRPKIVLSTNYSIKGNGSSYERRKYLVELNSFYTKEHTPMDDFEKRFFDDWKKKEWDEFYSFYFSCLRFYFKHGLVEEVKVNADRKKIQLDVGECFYKYFSPCRIAEMIFQSQQHEGIRIEDQYFVYKSEFPVDTSKLPLNTFSKRLNNIMDHYGVSYRKERKRGRGGKKEMFYTYSSNEVTDLEIITELVSLRNEEKPPAQLSMLANGQREVAVKDFEW